MHETSLNGLIENGLIEDMHRLPPRPNLETDRSAAVNQPK